MLNPVERDRVIRLYRLHFRAYARGRITRALKLLHAAEAANANWVSHGQR